MHSYFAEVQLEGVFAFVCQTALNSDLGPPLWKITKNHPIYNQGNLLCPKTRLGEGGGIRPAVHVASRVGGGASYATPTYATHPTYATLSHI